MTANLSNLHKKINLNADESLEPFCDVITDNHLDELGALLAPGEEKCFGNDCQIEMLSYTPVDTDENYNFLSELIKPRGWEINSLNFIHSQAYFHTQAESNIKIDVIWTVAESSDPKEVTEYYPIAIYFEDTEGSIFGDGPNYDPSDSGYWQEFLYDMEIETDPFVDFDE